MANVVFSVDEIHCFRAAKGFKCYACPIDVTFPWVQQTNRVVSSRVTTMPLDAADIYIYDIRTIKRNLQGVVPSLRNRSGGWARDIRAKWGVVEMEAIHVIGHIQVMCSTNALFGRLFSKSVLVLSC